MTDESCDRAYYSEDEANRYADAVGETVDYLQMSDGLEPELRQGLCFFRVQMFREGQTWGHPQGKSNRFVLDKTYELNGYVRDGLVLTLYGWGKSEQDVIQKADTLRRELIESGRWPESTVGKTFAAGDLVGKIE